EVYMVIGHMFRHQSRDADAEVNGARASQFLRHTLGDHMLHIGFVHLDCHMLTTPSFVSTCCALTMVSTKMNGVTIASGSSSPASTISSTSTMTVEAGELDP